MSTIGVVVTSFNRPDLLSQCLRSLSRQTVQPDRIVVVDNGSDGDSVRRVCRPWTSVDFVRLDRNRGFAFACNCGIRAAEGCEWVSTLNDDAFPAEDWIEELRTAIRRNPDSSVFASRLVRHDDPARREGGDDVYHVSGLAWKRGHGADSSDDLQQRACFSACAAAAVYRRTAFLNAGGFDEDYFCYLEDVDLGFRLQLGGHQACCVPQAVARHIGSATAGPGSPFALYHFHRNMVWTFVKNMPGALLLVYLPQHILINLAAVLWYSRKGLGRLILESKLDACRGLRQVLRKRSAIQRNRTLSSAQVRRLLARSPLQPYLGHFE